MPITWGWYDWDNQIVVGTFVGRWTWTEYFLSEVEGDKVLNQAVARWDAIIDMTQVDYVIPPDTLTLWRQSAHRIDQEFPNWGLSVITTSHQLPHLIYKTARWLSPVVQAHYRVAHTIPEALMLIHADRADGGAGA